MKKNEANEIAMYIAGALGKSGINIKCCTSRLLQYTHEVTYLDCEKFISSAFEMNKKSSDDAVDYLAAVLILHGVENPDIWWKDSPKRSDKETKNSIKEEIRHMLQEFEIYRGCAGYFKGRKESATEDHFRARYERMENESGEKASILKKDIINMTEFLAR